MARLEQLFIGCSFQSGIRKNYDRLKAELEAETPLRVVLADTTVVSSTDDLLEHITDLIRDSAACVFDATGANPNVSLEVGIAHALPVDFILTISTRRPTSRAGRKASHAPADRSRALPSGMRAPIIADLQGRNRIEYKTYRSLKDQLFRRYLVRLPYLKRWLDFEKTHKSYSLLALQVLQEIRASGRTNRPRLDAVLSGSGVSATALTRALIAQHLVSLRGGAEGGYVYAFK
jgi:hypothetical protein